MQSANKESIYMPDGDHLAQGLQRVEFTRRYENMDNPAYVLVVAEIEPSHKFRS